MEIIIKIAFNTVLEKKTVGRTRKLWKLMITNVLKGTTQIVTSDENVDGNSDKYIEEKSC
jgi:hypothetical protein